MSDYGDPGFVATDPLELADQERTRSKTEGHGGSTCECGHLSADHRSVRRPLAAALKGVCFIDGCRCREFSERSA